MRATISVFTTERSAIWLRPETPPYVARKYENPEHVVTATTDMECYSSLGIGRNGNDCKKPVCYHVTFGLENCGVFERWVMSVLVPQKAGNLRTSDSLKRHSVTWV
jgi:hypothetical protein